MSRNKGQNGQVLRVRADLEAALGALAQHEVRVSMVDLRIRQAIQRSGLRSLLEPACDELHMFHAEVCDARAQVISALERLSE